MTTYAMALRLKSLQSKSWDVVLLDEARTIKNPGAKQARTIKALPSQARIIMTGTPVENNLTELWSLFGFLNPGLLGTRKEFSAFTKQMEEQSNGYARLRTTVAPFILRRLEMDKNIIKDLPERTERTTRVQLSKKQAALYKKAVSDLERFLKTAEGIQRKGLVLATFSKLKQLYNHPDQYLGQKTFAPQESGKSELLQEVCQTIFAKR